MNKRILIVEDDAALSRLLSDNLAYEGFLVECAANGAEALRRVRESAPDLIVLDLMLPKVDGFEVCRAVSASPARTPIIIVTAKHQVSEKIRGLELGADDYVTKPFQLNELLARVRAVLRRARPAADELRIGDLLVDFRRQRSIRGNTEVTFTHREYDVLRYLAERVGVVVSRDELLLHVWGYNTAPLSRAVDNLIGRLRRKVETDPRRPRYLRTAHRDGYCLIVNDG